MDVGFIGLGAILEAAAHGDGDRDVAALAEVSMHRAATIGGA